MFNGKRIAVVMPAYNAAETLRKTHEAVVAHGIVDKIILVDDASSDGTADIAEALEKTTLHVHPRNRGYGANQKTCYRLALEAGADVVIMVHPDYQYTPALIPAMASMVSCGLYSCVLASRILGGGALKGGMPWWKYVANRFLTAVDLCETRKELCWRSNRDVPLNLAEYCSTHDAFLVHVSTDYVFSGNRPLFVPSVEGDPPDPISEYGRSKLAGEQAVVECFEGRPSYAILRAAWLYGLDGVDFLGTVLQKTRDNPGRPLPVVDDQFGSPTWSRTLAQQIKVVAEARAPGLFHATSGGHCSWYELACAFLDAIGERHCVVPCTTAEYPTAARRPVNSILENRRLKELGINVFTDWKTELDRFAVEFKESTMPGFP